MLPPLRRLLPAMLSALAASSPSIAPAFDTALLEDGAVVIKVWDTREGLPQASATAMARAPDGYLWFGTFEGFVRFDGVRFDVFDRARCPHLPSNAVVRLLFDRAGRLWIGTDRGLAVMSGGAVRPPPEGPVPEGLIESIVEDDRGRIIVSGPDRKITVFEDGRPRELATPGEATGLTFDAVTLVSSAGRIFAERGKKIFLLDSADVWTEIAELESEILALGARAAGGIFAADERTIHAVDKDRRELFATFEEPRGFDYGYLNETRDGGVWFSSHVHGVTEYIPGKKPRRFSREEGFPQNSIRFVFEDDEDNLWIGTDGAGLVSLRRSAFRTYAGREGLRENIVRALFEEAPGKWLVATHGSGLVRFENGTFGAPIRTIPGNEVPPRWVWALMRANDGAIWAGFFENGVARMGADLRHPQFPENIRPTVRALAQDASGTVWIATESGLFKSDAAATKIEAHPLNGAGAQRITSLLARRDELWIGTEEDGVWRVTERGTERVSSLRMDSSDLAEAGISAFTDVPRGVVALIEDSRGSVWASLEGGYLVRWKDGRMMELGPNAGIPRARIRGIADDGRGGLWLATSQGAVRVDLAAVDSRTAGARGRVAMMRLDIESGLPNRELNAVVRSSTGELWFASLGGIAVIDPSTLRTSAGTPHAMFETLTLVDRTGRPEMKALAADTPAIEVEPEPSHIGLTFTSPAFVRPEDVVFDLVVDGPGQRSTRELRARKFELLHPAPGLYRFRLSATDRFGARSEPAELVFTVEPLLRETLWFRGSVIAAALLAVGSSVGLIYRRRLRAANDSLQREQRLRESEEHRRELLETSQSPIWVLDADARWQMMTRPAELIFGSAPNQMIGRRFMESSLHEAVDRAFLAELAATDQSLDHLTAHRRVDGAEILLRLKAVARRDRDGKLAGYAGTAIDVTEEHRAREERERVERKIVEAQRLESLGQLAGGIAHDFNNILTAIGLNVEYLATQAQDPDSIDAIKTIQIVSQRAAGLCKQMLAFSGRGRFELTAVDVGALAESTAKLVRTASFPDVRFDFEARGNLPAINGDPSQIAQVMMNIYLNGAEAIGKRQGRVLTRFNVAEGNEALFRDAVIAPKDPHQRFVAVTISDDGCGMSAETMTRIFDPFFSTKATGRGLGLAAVLGIVRGHSGALKVSSEVGHGTQFELWLPASEETRRAVEVFTPSKPRIPVGATVLLADDEELIRKTLARLLARRGLDVVQCTNGREAVDAFQPNRFWIVFLDLTMPVMGGLEAIDLIHAKSPGQRVVLMSGYDATDASAHPGAKRALAFMGKPFTLDDVDRILQIAFEVSPS